MKNIVKKGVALICALLVAFLPTISVYAQEEATATTPVIESLSQATETTTTSPSENQPTTDVISDPSEPIVPIIPFPEGEQAVTPETPITETPIDDSTPPETQLDDSTSDEDKTDQTESTLTEDPTPPQSYETSGLAFQKSSPQPDPLTGALIYSYPIKTPPGRAGIEPSLALTYDSSANSNVNIAGYDWSLNIPVIERVNKNGNDKMYDEDYFTSSLSGELASTSSSGVYVSRVDSGEFLKYVYDSSLGWTVYDKYGNTYYFGTTTDSRTSDPNNSSHIAQWYLNEIRDTNGNFINYNYVKYGNQVYPDYITYTNNASANTTGIFKVTFVYESRSDTMSSKRLGFIVTNEKKLQTINTYVNNTLVRKYDLSYTTGVNGVRSILSSITETGYDDQNNSLSLPATTFTYTSGSENTLVSGGIDQGVSYGGSSGWCCNVARKGPVYTDLNGDGYIDSFELYYSDWYQQMQSSYTMNSLGNSSTPTLPPLEFQYHVNNGAEPQRDYGNRVFDINGDGFVDFMGTPPAYGAPPPQVERTVYISNASVTDNVRFNGSTTTAALYGTPTKIGDTNGDGLPEFSTDTDIYTYVDWNGDGVDEAVKLSDPPESLALVNTTYGMDNGVRYIDYNADGLPDILQGLENTASGLSLTSQNKIYINTGNDFTLNSNASSTVFVSISNPQYTSTLYDYHDTNGDGIVDLPDSPTNPADILKTITYPTGGNTAIEYKPSTQYKNGSSLMNPKLPNILWTVSKITQNDGLYGTQVVENYAYAGGRMYWNGQYDRKFAGFEKITKTAGNIVTETYYHQGNEDNSSYGEVNDSYGKIGYSYMTEVYDNSGHILSRVQNIYATSTLANASNPSGFASSTPVFTYLSKKIEELYNSSGEHKDKATEYKYNESNGNLIQTINYGEVTSGSSYSYPSQMFTDVGNDLASTTISYVASTTASQGTLSTGLFSYWKLDESSGSASDSVNSRTLTQGGNTVYATGKINNGATFDGTDDYLTGGDVLDFERTDPFSISAWFNCTSTSVTRGIVSKFDGDNGYGLEFRDYGHLAFYIGSGGSMAWVRTANTFSTNAWHHVVLTYNGNSSYTGIKIYVDGSEQSFDSSGGSANSSLTSFPFNIGSNNNGGYADFAGTIDEVGVWSRVLTSQEIAELYNSGSGMQYPFSAEGGDGGILVLTLPYDEITQDQSSNKVRETKHYYDAQSLGQATLGNETKTEFWKESSNFASTTKTYDGSYGFVVSSTDANGNVTNYTLDSNNLYVATSTNALIQAIGYTYDYASGKKKSIFDPNGVLHTVSYDAFRRPLTVKEPDPNTGELVTKISYIYTDSSTAGSTLVQQTDNLSSATSTNTYTHLDGLGRNLQQRRQAEGDNTYTVKDWTYNNKGMVNSESLPYFASSTSKSSATSTSALFTTYTYDPLNRISKTENAVGSTTNTYDRWTVTTVDPNGNKKDYAKDAYGNLVSVVEYVDDTPYTTSYEWNLNKNLTKITDALGNVRNFTYDGLNRRITAEDLHAPGDSYYGSYSYTYDDAGNLTQKVDAKSQTVNYTYDMLNRPLTENYTDQAGIETTYSYDSCGNGIGHTCTASSTDSLTSNIYNPLGLVSEATTTISGIKYKTQLSYDRLGHQIFVVNPDDSRTGYAYNSAGYIDLVSSKKSGDTATTTISSFDYSPIGQITSNVSGNGVRTVNTYNANALYRLTNKKSYSNPSSPLQDLSYSYNNNGNITSITSSSSISIATSTWYTYDELNRLTSSSQQDNTTSTTTEPTLPTGIVSYWKMDESSGNASDAVGTNTLTNNNSVGFSAGKINNTASLASASSKNFSISNASQSGLGVTGSFTISTWIKMTTSPGQAIASKYSDENDNGYMLYVPASGVIRFIIGNSSYKTSTATMTTGNWYHVVGVYNGSSIKVYINGVEDTGTQTGTVPSSVSTNSRDFNVGRCQGPSPRYWNGMIDEIGFWSRALTDSEISQLYNDGDGLQHPFPADDTILSNTTYYTYDILGNILSKTQNGTTLTYHYDGNTDTNYANPHAVTSMTASGSTVATFTYDHNGNLIEETGLHPALYDWTHDNHIASSTYQGKVNVYGYDPSGQRVKVYTASTTETTLYPTNLYNELYNTLGSTTAKTSHILANDLTLATIASTTTNGPTMTYHLTDHLGSVTASLDSEGSITSQTDYEAYGHERLSEGQKVTDRGFIGERTDSFDELNYFQNRYLNSQRGQFLSEDSTFLVIGDKAQLQKLTGQDQNKFLTNPQQLNGYSYAQNNPIVNKDPTGNCIEDLCIGEIMLGYSLAQVAVDSYDAYNTNIKYGNYFTPEEKYQTNFKLGLDFALLGTGEVAKFVGSKGIGTALDMMTGSLDINDTYNSESTYDKYNKKRQQQDEGTAVVKGGGSTSAYISKVYNSNLNTNKNNYSLINQPATIQNSYSGASINQLVQSLTQLVGALSAYVKSLSVSARAP